MRKIYNVLLLVLGLLSPGLAVAECKSSVEWLFDTAWKSAYLSTSGQVIYNRPVLQSSITGFWCGLYGGVWHSTDLSQIGRYSSGGDEVDLYVGYNHQFKSGLWVDVSVSSFDIPSGFMNFGSEDIGQVAVSFGGPFTTFSSEKHQFSWWGTVEVPFTLQSGFHGEKDVRAGIDYSYAFTSRLTLGATAKVGYDDGVVGQGMFVGGVGSLTYTIKEGVEAFATLEGFAPLTERAPQRGLTEVVSVGIKLTW